MYTKDIMYGKICEVTSHIEYSKFDIDNINKFLIAIDKEFYQINQSISFIDVLKNCNRNTIDIDYAELGFVANTISSIGLEYSINDEIIKEWLRIIKNEAKRIVSNKILEIDNIPNGYNSIENIWNMLKCVSIYKHDIDSELRKYVFEKASGYIGVKGTNNKDKGNNIRSWLGLPTLKKQYKNKALQYFYFLSKQTSEYLSCEILQQKINVHSEYVFQLAKNIILTYETSSQDDLNNKIYSAFSHFKLENNYVKIVSKISCDDVNTAYNILKFIRNGRFSGYTIKELICLVSEKYNISYSNAERIYYKSLKDSNENIKHLLGNHGNYCFVWDKYSNNSNKNYINFIEKIMILQVARKEYDKAREYNKLNTNERYRRASYFSNVVEKYREILSKTKDEYVHNRVIELYKNRNKYKKSIAQKLTKEKE